MYVILLNATRTRGRGEAQKPQTLSLEIISSRVIVSPTGQIYPQAAVFPTFAGMKRIWSDASVAVINRLERLQVSVR